MKTVKRLLVATLVIAAIFSAFAFSAAAADTAGTVFWSVWSGIEEGSVYKPFAVKGEISTGTNNVNVNDGCVSFDAESSGYYAMVITVDPSEQKSGVAFDLATADSENKADCFFSTYGPGEWIDIVEDGNGYSGIAFYIDNPGTYYFRFYYEDYIDGKYITNEIFGCSADLRFLGDFVSVSLGKDPLYLGTDVASVWGDNVVCFNCDLSFSDGNTYSCGMFGDIDELAPGERKLSFNISNGPEIRTGVNLISLAETVEKIVLPDDFTPAVTYHFSGNICDLYDRTYSYPEYVELHFGNGTVKKVEIKTSEYWLVCSGGFTLDGEEHYVETKYVYIDETEWVFRVLIDGVCFDEKPVKNDSSFVSDLTAYFAGVKRLVPSVHSGSISDAVSDFGTAALLFRSLTKALMDYFCFVLDNRIAFI